MKVKTVTKLAALAVVLSLSVIGCRKGLDKTTPLPGHGAATVPNDTMGKPIGDGNTANANNTKPLPGNDTTTVATPIPPGPGPDRAGNTPLSGKLSDYVNAPEADQIFRSKTVYFAFDQATVKPSEVSKIEEVASGMKGLTGKALRIEGHCDERGTEEYNRSLGERRALAIREALVRAGVDAGLIDTISYGEDKPVDPGHNEAAWSKNRRGEFIVIVPPSASTSK